MALRKCFINVRSACIMSEVHNIYLWEDLHLEVHLADVKFLFSRPEHLKEEKMITATIPGANCILEALAPFKVTCPQRPPEVLTEVCVCRGAVGRRHGGCLGCPGCSGLLGVGQREIRSWRIIDLYQAPQNLGA